MHTNTYRYLKSNKKQNKEKKERERVENDLSGVVGDVEEMSFKITFERRQ